LLTFYSCNIRKNKPNKAVIGSDINLLIYIHLAHFGLGLDELEVVLHAPQASQAPLGPLTPYDLNKPMQCLFKLLCPSSSNWPT